MSVWQQRTKSSLGHRILYIYGKQSVDPHSCSILLTSCHWGTQSDATPTPAASNHKSQYEKTSQSFCRHEHCRNVRTEKTNIYILHYIIVSSRRVFIGQMNKATRVQLQTNQKQKNINLNLLARHHQDEGIKKRTEKKFLNTYPVHSQSQINERHHRNSLC